MENNKRTFHRVRWPEEDKNKSRQTCRTDHGFGQTKLEKAALYFAAFHLTVFPIVTFVQMVMS